VRWGFRLALLLLVPTLAGALTREELIEGGHVRMRVFTEPARQVVLGQQTRLLVEILTDTWFTKAPGYPELSLEGAVALMPEQLGTNFTERIDGVTFAAQRRGYVIYPQRVGPLEIPSIPVRLGVAVDAEPSAPFTIATHPVRLQVVLPPDAARVESFVTTPRLTMRESWNRPLEELQVGDALKRTVRLGAENALGMLLPELSFEAPAGIKLYPEQPRTEDRVERGRYRGERVESVTYVLQREGEFTLPAIDVHWWNPDRGILVTETLEAHSFLVQAGEQEAQLVVARRLRADWRRLLARVWVFGVEHWLLLVGVALGVGLAARLLRTRGPLVLAWLRAESARREASEAAGFRSLERSLRSGDVDAVVRSYWRWLDRLRTEIPALDARGLRRAAESSGFAEVWAALESARYGAAGEGFDQGALRRALRAFRAELRAPGHPETPLGDFLNPRGAGSR
jgi:hypothetical protein